MHIAPTHKAFDAYETTLADYRDRKVTNEGAVRFAFQTLLTLLTGAVWNYLKVPQKGFEQLDADEFARLNVRMPPAFAV